MNNERRRVQYNDSTEMAVLLHNANKSLDVKKLLE